VNRIARPSFAALSLTFLCNLLAVCAFSQGGGSEKGQFSGDLQVNQNFFQYDSLLLGNDPPPQYSKQLSSSEAWLNLNYRVQDYSFGVRFDAYQNSGLRNPRSAYTQNGLGFWYARRTVDKLDITAGYFYDQFGSGITFRAYEGRAQALDYTVRGIRLIYDLDDKTKIKTFVGQQKYLFDVYQPVMKGANIERFIQLGSDTSRHKLQLTPGANIVNRTLDDNNINLLVNQINGLPLEQRFIPKYNVYVYSFYTTLQYQNFNVYAEYAGKSKEAILNAEANLVNKGGSVAYTSASYSRPGFGVNVQYKRTETFEFRTSPNEILNNGLVNYIPPLARMNTWRLAARYAPATQLIGEQGVSVDVTWSPKEHFQFAFNYSNVSQLNGIQLYREYFLETKQRWNDKLRTVIGAQVLYYDQGIYELEREKPPVENIVPFAEITYRLTRRKSLRFEVSQMETQQDLGSWLWMLAEFNIAPRYSFSIMDMWNYGNLDKERRFHYYTGFLAVNFGRNRIAGGYIRQVQGVNCTGGVCRVEPAFNGVRFTLTSNF